MLQVATRPIFCSKLVELSMKSQNNNRNFFGDAEIKRKVIKKKI